MLLEGRKQPRTCQRFLIQIFAVHDPLVTEIATVEDVSTYGSRLATWRAWEPGQQVDLKSSSGELCARARVVYCRTLGVKAFSIGLNFLSQTGAWESRSISSPFKQTI